MFENEDSSYLDTIYEYNTKDKAYLNTKQIKSVSIKVLKNNWLKLSIINLLFLVAVVFSFVLLFFLIDKYHENGMQINYTHVLVQIVVFYLLTQINHGIVAMHLEYVKTKGKKLSFKPLVSYFHIKIIRKTILMVPLAFIIFNLLFNESFLVLIALVIFEYTFPYIEYVIYESVYYDRKLKENIFKESYKLMRGHKDRLLQLNLSFAGWRSLIVAYIIIVYLMAPTTSMQISVAIIIGILPLTALSVYSKTAFAIFYRDVTSTQYKDIAFIPSRASGELNLKNNYPYLIKIFVLRIHEKYNISETEKEKLDSIMNDFIDDLNHKITYYLKKDQRQQIIQEVIELSKNRINDLALNDDLNKEIFMQIEEFSYDYGLINEYVE